MPHSEHTARISVIGGSTYCMRGVVFAGVCSLPIHSLIFLDLGRAGAIASDSSGSLRPNRNGE